MGYGIEGFSNTERWNNSLAGYDNCVNSNLAVNRGGTNASAEWVQIYLQNATARINALIDGVDFTVEDIYAMQTTCPYEYVCTLRMPVICITHMGLIRNLGCLRLQSFLSSVHIPRMGGLRVQH